MIWYEQREPVKRRKESSQDLVLFVVDGWKPLIAKQSVDEPFSLRLYTDKKGSGGVRCACKYDARTEYPEFSRRSTKYLGSRLVTVLCLSCVVFISPFQLEKYIHIKAITNGIIHLLQEQITNPFATHNREEAWQRHDWWWWWCCRERMSVPVTGTHAGTHTQTDTQTDNKWTREK